MDSNRFSTSLPPVSPVVSFDAAGDGLLLLDLTESNAAIRPEIIYDTSRFREYITAQIAAAGARYGIGGYAENRNLYSRSKVFDAAVAGDEPRRLHLGIDIWGEAGTPVYAPLAGTVHSFAFNDNFGDYGATIILQHVLPAFDFYSLYGHLSLRDLDGLYEGKPVAAGDCIAHFGIPAENGYWPPHLHFQLIMNMEGMKGDYPGVCKLSEREKYLANCPDPDTILRMLQYAHARQEDLR